MMFRPAQMRSLYISCALSATMILLYVSVFFNPGIREKVNQVVRGTLIGTYKGTANRVIYERNRQVAEMCDVHAFLKARATTQQFRAMYKSMYVNDEHHFLYCDLPKVAGTSWKSTLLLLTDNVDTTDPLQPTQRGSNAELDEYRTLDSYTPQQIEYRLSHYFKFMFVRRPFERLLSAYMDTFIKSHSLELRKKYGCEILTRYRKDPPTKSVESGDGVTFNEFVEYLIDPITLHSEWFDTHWRPFHEQCMPCCVEYDYIGKYETLSEDALNILRIVNASNLHVPAMSGSGGRIVDKLDSYYGNITTKHLQGLFKVYANDFEMFGYTFP